VFGEFGILIECVQIWIAPWEVKLLIGGNFLENFINPGHATQDKSMELTLGCKWFFLQVWKIGVRQKL
jgi:hypothetical protein